MESDARTRRQVLLGAGAASVAGLAGCAGYTGGGAPGTRDQHETASGSSGRDDGDAHGGGLDGPRASATVSMATTDGGSHFEPHVVRVKRGGSVTWELESGTHTTTAYSQRTHEPHRIPDGASAWDSGTPSEQDETFEHTFETVGVYDYCCIPHGATGMVGTVVVGDPETGDRPGLQPPRDGRPDGAAEKVASLNERVTAALDDTGGEGSDGGHDGSSSHGSDSGHS